jgi:hypothetical protein
VGMAYEAGAFDCSDLVALVLRELFGQALALPPHAERPGGRAGRRALIRGMQEQLAKPLDAPELGAVALMQQSVDGGGTVWHLGVIFGDANEWWVLHNAQTLGGVWLHRMKELGRLGLQMEGVYSCAA